MALYKDGAFVPDPWRRVDAVDDLPAEGQFLVSVENWRNLALPKQRTNVAFGVLLEPGQAIETMAEYLPYLALVAIGFPKYTDGRGYSMARQIRDCYQFGGELRATGDVLFDQLQLMARCGFDAFEIIDPVTIKLLESGRRSPMTHFYQPAEGNEERVAVGTWRRKRKLISQ